MKIKPLADSAALALESAFPHAPYLRRTAERIEGAFETISEKGPEIAFDQALEKMHSDTCDEAGLRQAKAAAHLAVAAADLSGQWALDQVTGAVTELADAAVEAAMRLSLESRGLNGAGLFAVALGKMGARELNYSSDIDIAIFYNPDIFDGGEKGFESASKVAQDIVRLLDTRTEDGYVFRTDLRLRPDPSSTPLAVSTLMAQGYYETVGQNWERMVWIKARLCAGDQVAGAQFLQSMQPFVWRRHLDYWAIADVHAIKRMINASKQTGAMEQIDPDVKLSPGGIREIEFFAQTQQIILGGRDPGLREASTLNALDALMKCGVVASDVEQALGEAYTLLRHIEHRIQMREDQQSHKLPEDDEQRAHIAALCGARDLAQFDEAVRQTRKTVHAHYYDLFGEEDRATQSDGNLVFTGVDDDPGTVETLSAYGFGDPSKVIEQIRRWHRGEVPAARSARGRELLTKLIPSLLEEMARAGDPDTAFQRFSDFLRGLRSTVQTLSMLLNESELLADLVATMTIAPRLGQTLSRRPELLEALLDGGDRSSVAWPEDFEGAMDEMRRQHRDQEFLIGHRLLHGHLKAADAASEWSALADSAVQRMGEAAERETTRRFGPPPGRWSICAMGRLGGSDMTAGSDLDIMVVYDADDGQADAQTWFTRFTQRLITALSAPTAEGSLYEVDMRLRPSGRSGPVAVKLSAFEKYHKDASWTWEHMALTRLRHVAGDRALGDAVLDIAADVIKADADKKLVLDDIANMRARLLKEKPGKGLWDLKLDSGGVLDIEFIAQLLMLKSGDADLIASNTDKALKGLVAANRLEAQQGDCLLQALYLQSALLQVIRIAVGTNFNPELATPALKDRLVRAAQETSFDGLEDRLRHSKRQVCDVRDRFYSVAATDS